MYATLFLIVAGASPEQAVLPLRPAPPQQCILPPLSAIPPSDPFDQTPVRSAGKTCSCSSGCSCGCNEGRPCTCGSPTVGDGPTPGHWYGSGRQPGVPAGYHQVCDGYGCRLVPDQPAAYYPQQQSGYGFNTPQFGFRFGGRGGS